MKPPAERILVIGAIAAALLPAVVVASLPVYTLVGVVPDDAFYYMVVGRNIAATGVSTFDGENLASGYHPAWMMLVTAVARWFPTNGGLLRVVVAMSLLLHATAGWLLYLCLRRFVSGVVAALAAGFWMFGYLPLLVAGFALETSLYCVAFLLSYLVYLQRVEPYLRPTSVKGQDRIPTANLLLFGAALGLCVWARTEGIVLVACAVAWLGIAALRREAFFKSLCEACRRNALTVGAALAAISPWLAYSLHTFGTIRQASGVMKTLWRQEEVAGLNWGEQLAQFASRFGTWLVYSLPWTWGGSLGVGVAVALGWLALFVAAAVYVLHRPAESRRSVAGVSWSVAYPLLHVLAAGVIYSVCFTDVQSWYLALPYLETYLAIVILGGTICRAAGVDDRARRWPARAFAVAAVFTIVGLVRYELTFEKGYWAWQRDVYASIGAVEKLTPEGARIGCFNAGIPAYFGRRHIINLDGLINDAVVPYWRARAFDRYLVDADIRVIVDDELSLARARRFSHAMPELEEVARYPLTRCITDTRFLWTLKHSADRRKKPSP